MLDLLTPTAHTSAYEWAAVLLAHSMVGVVLTGVVARAVNWWSGVTTLQFSAKLVSAIYLIAWEIGVQRLGAGVLDALVDWSAVTLGGLMAWGAWANRARMAGGAVAILSIIGAIGMGRRK